MKHLIKHGLGSLKCCAWVALAFGFNLSVVDRVAQTLLQKYFAQSTLLFKPSCNTLFTNAEKACVFRASWDKPRLISSN